MKVSLKCHYKEVREADQQVEISHSHAIDPNASEEAMEEVGQVEAQIHMDLGLEEVEREVLAKQQRNKALQQSNEAAELCPECGSVMVAQGTCFYCQECGATTGCS